MSEATCFLCTTMKAQSPALGEAYELEPEMGDCETEAFLDGDDGAHFPHFRRGKRSVRAAVADFVRSPYGAIFFVSVAVVVVLSIYFYVPSTLFVYLVCMLFAFPLVLAVDVARVLHHRRLPPTLGAWLRLALCALATAYTATCVVGVVLDTPYADPRAPPARAAHRDYNPQNQTFYIASNLFNSERILPRYSEALLQFIEDVGPRNVYVSIYENDSQDRTPELLHALDAELDRRGVRRRIKTVTKRKGFKNLKRIRRLAYLRNEAMDPLWVELGGRLDGRAFERVVFLNDILFDTEALHTLLGTHGGVFDQACAIDYYAIGLYDTYVFLLTQLGDARRQRRPRTHALALLCAPRRPGARRPRRGRAGERVLERARRIRRALVPAAGRGARRGAGRHAGHAGRRAAHRGAAAAQRDARRRRGAGEAPAALPRGRAVPRVRVPADVARHAPPRTPRAPPDLREPPRGGRYVRPRLTQRTTAATTTCTTTSSTGASRTPGTSSGSTGSRRACLAP